MKKHHPEGRGKIPRKAKSNIIGLEEVNQIRKALKNDIESNKRKKGPKGKSSKKKVCESPNQNNIIPSLENRLKDCHESNLELTKITNTGLSHFMHLEERKDLMVSGDDPLSINGPEVYDTIGWGPVKEEIPDEVEGDCVTFLTVQEIPKLVHPEDNVPQEDVNKNEVISEDVERINRSEDCTDDSRGSEGSIWKDSKYCDDESFEETKIKSGERKYVCDICDKELSTKVNLRLHKKKKHKIDVFYNCDLCSEKFNMQKDLVKHRNVHRGDDGNFNCEECGKRHLHYYNFVNHMRTHYRNDVPFVDVAGKSSVSCGDCGRSFKSSESLSTHVALIHNAGGTKERLKNQEKNFVCHKCGKKFSFACLLRDHMNVHNGVTPYLCQCCGRAFAQKASLKQHMRTHNKVKPFKCKECGKGFYANGDLKKHFMTHSGERPFVCEICGDSFTRNTHLGVHRRSHTGERPFICDICNRGFTKKGDVVRHRRIHTGEFPYLCVVCGKSFRQSTQCNNHIKNKHPNATATTTKAVAMKSVSQWVVLNI